MWYINKRLSNWSSIIYIKNVQQTEVISGFLFLFITHKLWEHLVGVFTVSWYIFKVLFNDYDITTLKIIHPITFRNYTKHPIKVLQNKNNIHATFLQKGFPHSVWAFLYRMYLIRETFLRYKTKTFCLTFNYEKESTSSKICSEVIKQNWAKFSETWKENLV